MQSINTTQSNSLSIFSVDNPMTSPNNMLVTVKVVYLSTYVDGVSERKGERKETTVLT